MEGVHYKNYHGKCRMSRGIVRQLNMLLHAIVEWLLVAVGIMLAVIALRGIDVAGARYGVTAIGLLLSIAGLFFRFRRIRLYSTRKRKQE